MNESPEDYGAVEQLLRESDALHGWLTRLEQAQVAAPDSVRERVRHDYQQRLDQLTAGLRAHHDAIAARLADDRREHESLSTQARASRDHLAEAELRHAVGEYDRARFDAERRRHDSDIETFDLGIGAVAERIARLEAVQARVERGPGGAESGTQQPSGEQPEDSPEVHVIEDIGEELTAIADLSPDGDPDRLLAIFDETHLAGSPGRDAAPAPSNPPGDAGPLSFRPNPVRSEPARPAEPPARARPSDAAAPLGLPPADQHPRFIRPGERIGQGHESVPAPAPRAAAAEPASETSELFDEDIVAVGPTPDAAQPQAGRTLRCGECGAMNRPLEWYCEKCGAELTAV
jgi:hypothetical protein